MLTFKTEYTSVSIDETTELRDFGITTIGYHYLKGVKFPLGI